MRRTIMLIVAVLGLAAAGCSNLGLGELDCSALSDDTSSSTIITIQAVPSAAYTPCLEELRLGWDSVDWFAEDGRAGIEIADFTTTFLTVAVTPSCDVSDATPVDSDRPDIERYEDIEFQQTDIEIVVVPSAAKPLLTAHELVDALADVQIDDRPVTYTIDASLSRRVGSRVDEALERVDFVWIIDEVDVEEGTVQMRSNRRRGIDHGLEPDDAIDLVEDTAPDVFYRGNWYFTFEGGCITYAFDARGLLAETVAADAEDAIGFYPAAELRRQASEAGFEIG